MKQENLNNLKGSAILFVGTAVVVAIAIFAKAPGLVTGLLALIGLGGVAVLAVRGSKRSPK